MSFSWNKTWRNYKFAWNSCVISLKYFICPITPWPWVNRLKRSLTCIFLSLWYSYICQFSNHFVYARYFRMSWSLQRWHKKCRSLVPNKFVLTMVSLQADEEGTWNTKMPSPRPKNMEVRRKNVFWFGIRNGISYDVIALPFWKSDYRYYSAKY